MLVVMIIAVCTINFIRPTRAAMHDFYICHDDFNLNPTDGVLREHTFPWLGFVQYIHVTTGLPHHSKAPRVVLVHKQFVAGTALDLLHLPKNYKLGNVVFGEYERDEEDCTLTRTDIKSGNRCPRAYIEVPALEITPHPEFSRFGVGNSLALVKLLRPMKSNYMIPVCLPSVSERNRKKIHKVVYLIDYISSKYIFSYLKHPTIGRQSINILQLDRGLFLNGKVLPYCPLADFFSTHEKREGGDIFILTWSPHAVPRDFNSERMGKKTFKLYTHRECKRHRMKARLGSEGVTHVLCSSGCGVRPGAPIISHSAEGRFELMGLAAGGAPCSRRSMRRRLNIEPPLYVDVFPYSSWIINVITAHAIPKAYPQNFQLVEGGYRMGTRRASRLDYQLSGWKARIFLKGNMCFRSPKVQRRASFFYVEKFQVTADPPAKLNIVMQINAGVDCKIVCARFMMPNRLSAPTVTGVGTSNITIRIETDWFPYAFFFSVGLSGMNYTRGRSDTWYL